MSATAYSHYPLKNPGNTYIHSTRLKVQGNKFLQFQWIRYKILNYVTKLRLLTKTAFIRGNRHKKKIKVNLI